MQGSDSIYEIARLMKDENYIRSDLTRAMELVTDFFKKKYVFSFENEIKSQKADIQNNPSRELKLLSLMKEFIPKESHKELDNAINTLTTLSALSSIQKKLTASVENEPVIKAASASDPSVKQDGVYDIDENCNVSVQTSAPPSFYIILIVLFVFTALNNQI